MPLYAIKDPKGRLLENSSSTDRDETWWLANDLKSFKKAVATATRKAEDRTEREFFEYGGAEEVGKKIGYRCVRVYLTEEKP